MDSLINIEIQKIEKKHIIKAIQKTIYRKIIV